MIVDKELLFRELEKAVWDDSEYQVIPARNGGYTILFNKNGRQIYTDSKYDPVKAGAQFLESVDTEGNSIAVYGLGLGYHIKALAERVSDKQTIYVFEASFITTKIAFEKTDIIETLEKPNVVFYCSDDIKSIAARIDAVLSETEGELSIYPPSLSVIPDYLEKFRDILEEYRAQKKSLPAQLGVMEFNREFNAAAGYRNGVRLLAGAFRGMPAIIVAAGPSLDLNIGDLKKVADKALIICVARAARKLFEEGVAPDFYVATDALGWLQIHLDFNNEKMNAPLFLLSTADWGASEYRGEKLIIYEKDSVPESEKGFFIETGGSVATAALSLCVKLGADPVVFLGQDLCYCFDKTHSGPRSSPVVPMKGGKYVEANDGKKYYTFGNLYIYLKWIERFIARNTATQFYNATALGAVITGAPNIDLLTFFDEYGETRNKIESVLRSKGIC